MPFCLSLSTFLMSASFLLYGIFSSDPFIYVSFLSLAWEISNFFFCSSRPTHEGFLLKFQVPNGIGTLLGVTQLLLFAHYRNSSREDSAEGLIVSYS